MLVLLKIEADGDVMCSFDREEGGGVIFSVEYEVEAEGREDWTGSGTQSRKSTAAKTRNENSSSTSFAKDDNGRSTWW
jgi:stringent starvation protein B